MKGNAHIVKGASKGTSPRTSGLVAPASDGHWFLSPNASTVTVSRLELVTVDHDHENVSLNGCTPSYQRDAPELTSILDCPFEVATGSYRGLTITLATDAQVTVVDAVNGFYTDPSASSKLSATAPSGGSASVAIKFPTCPGCDGNSLEDEFVEPLDVAEGTPVEVTILEDMIHTMSADVVGGAPSFDLSLPIPPVTMIATAGVVTSGSVEYYAPTGTADNVNNGPGGTGNEAGAARVFFVNGKPSFIHYVTQGNSEAWAADPRTGQGSRLGGYLGLDASGTLCWANTTSDSLDWQDNGYSQICRLHRATAIGETTAIECKHQSTAPAPTSGGTYESGCPDFTPDMTTNVTLVAK